MRFNKLIILFLGCFIGSISFAQKSKDAGMWLTLSLQHPIAKKLNITLDQELRIKENYQRINLFYTNVGLSYRVNKFLKIEPTYRSIQKKQFEGYYSYRHRFMLDVIVKKKLSKFTMAERVRYQTEVADFYTSKKGMLAEQFLRFKTDLKYSLSEKITPYISCELRYQIHSPKGDGPNYDNGFHRIRNVAGIEYQVNKKNSINLYYLIQSEYYISTPESIYILGLGYSLTI